jgi:hemerythrin-like domain-containing protein
MTLRQTIQAAPGNTAELIKKLSETSNQAVKTREGLFAQLSDELTRYVEIEEQHFLPLLRKHAETKSLAADALKGNKDLRKSLEKLSVMPKDTDEFLAELDVLNKSFQQHVRNERKELLPAVLKAFSDEEAGELADSIEGAVADAEKVKREEKREENAQARRQAEEDEQARSDERAASRARKAAEQSAREASAENCRYRGAWRCLSAGQRASGDRESQGRDRESRVGYPRGDGRLQRNDADDPR